MNELFTEHAAPDDTASSNFDSTLYSREFISQRLPLDNVFLILQVPDLSKIIRIRCHCPHPGRQLLIFAVIHREGARSLILDFDQDDVDRKRHPALPKAASSTESVTVLMKSALTSTL